MSDGSVSYSDDSSTLEIVHDPDWYRNNLLQSGRIAALAVAIYINFVASLDPDTVLYSMCYNPSWHFLTVKIVFVSVRFGFVAIAVLTYYLISRIYEHSIGLACIIVGIITLACSFISKTGPALEYLRLIVELPLRYFGCTYIQACSLTAVFNWSFYGLELREMFRIWLMSMGAARTITLSLTNYACDFELGKGLPLVYIIYGSLLLGAGIIFVCGFRSTVSTESVRTSRYEKEALEKDHAEHGILNASESSLFKSMSFLKEVLRDGRHIFAVSILSSADISEFAAIHYISRNFGIESGLVVAISDVLSLILWASLSVYVDKSVEKTKILYKKFTVRPLIALSFGLTLSIISGGFIVCIDTISSIYPLFVCILCLRSALTQYLAVNGPVLRVLRIKPPNNHKCGVLFLIFIYGLTLFWGAFFHLWSRFIDELDLTSLQVVFSCGSVFRCIALCMYYGWEMIAMKSKTKAKLKTI